MGLRLLLRRLLDWVLRRKPKPMCAIVALLAEPYTLPFETVALAANRTLGIPLPPYGDEAPAFTVGDAPPYAIKDGPWLMIVHCFPGAYVDDVAAITREIRNQRVVRMLESHQAWMSVDVIMSPDECTLKDKYRRIGKLLAEFVEDVGDNCLGFLFPEEGYLRPSDEHVLEDLRSDDPFEAVSVDPNPPLIHVPQDDKKMQEGAREAQRRFPEFIQAWNTPGAGERFSVKGPIYDGEECEFIWIEIDRIEKGEITGKLANEPVYFPNLRINDTVTLAVDDVVDWIYLRDGKPVGGFQQQPLAEAYKG